jgi:hypothetical protein
MKAGMGGRYLARRRSGYAPTTSAPPPDVPVYVGAKLFGQYSQGAAERMVRVRGAEVVRARNTGLIVRVNIHDLEAAS